MPQWEMATTMRRRRDQRHPYALALTLAAILLNPCCVVVEAQEGPCPSNAILTGYASIAALNNDIQAEVNRVSQGGVPEEEYVFTLCPRQVFEVTTEPIRPQLSGAVFRCGVSGSSTDNCIIRGGSEQIRVEDSTIATYPLIDVTFRGLTFESFTSNAENNGTSVNVLASDITTVNFVDSIWTVSFGRMELPHSHHTQYFLTVLFETGI